MSLMAKTLTVILVVLIGALRAWAQGTQIVGVWELDQGRSNLPARAFPMGIKSEIRSYSLRKDGYLVALVLRVNGDGSPDFIQVAAKSDGKDYPQYQSGPLAELQIQGTPTRFTYSEKMTDGDVAEVVGKRDGQVINKGTRKISADGKTMTLNVAAILPDGQEIPIAFVFKKRE
jgi:hypothetical protein